MEWEGETNIPHRADPVQASRVPVLTDGVVTLGAQRLEDAPEILRGRQLPEVEHAWFGTKVTDLDHARYLVEYGLARWAEEENFFWAFAIRAKVDGPLLGSVVIHHSSRGEGSVLNIWLLPEHRRKDIARRAVALGLGYVFDWRGMPWVDIEVPPGNEEAEGVARRVGFVALEELHGSRDVDNVLPFSDDARGVGCARERLVTRRADPDRLHTARKIATRDRLIDGGFSEQTAQAWVDAWEREADGRGLDRQSPDYWKGAAAWILERKAGKRRLPE